MFTQKARGSTFYFCGITFFCFWLILSLFWSRGVCGADEQLYGYNPPEEIEDIWDPNRYISVDEVKPGMEAYCLTVYKGTEVEKFGLEVISVVRNVWPGRDAIFVQGTDERFIHTGPVGGCSGSPVYIDGRLAGALAFGWWFSKDPLYGVTPIEEMLRVGQGGDSESGAGGAEPMAYAFDFSKPIDFSEVYEQIMAADVGRRNSLGIATALPCPLVASGLPDRAVEELDSLVKPFGLMAVSGPGGGMSGGRNRDVELAPGSSLGVALTTGDITLDVIGTTTEVVGDKVYGFGHWFLGYGDVDLPMATAEVHAVVSNVLRSFKYASSLEVVGALTTDESTAVIGRIGAEPRMIPMTITVDRYNDPERRVYNCRVADNRRLTWILLYISLYGTMYTRGTMPPDHMLEYKTAIEVEGAEPIVFENVSTGRWIWEMMRESVAPVVVLMNNPYRKVNIKSIDYKIRILPKNIASHIWSVDLSDSKLKVGEQLDVSVIVESRLAEKKKYRYSLKIPESTPPGNYELVVCGGYDYLKFIKRAAPYRFVPENLTSLVEIMNNILQTRRDRLHCLLILPPGGVALERAELPDLPATKALILQNPRRAIRQQPYLHWIEKSLGTGTVIVDKKVMSVKVERE